MNAIYWVCADPDILYWKNTDDDTITHNNLLHIELPKFLGKTILGITFEQ